MNTMSSLGLLRITLPSCRSLYCCLCFRRLRLKTHYYSLFAYILSLDNLFLQAMMHHLSSMGALVALLALGAALPSGSRKQSGSQTPATLCPTEAQYYLQSSANNEYGAVARVGGGARNAYYLPFDQTTTDSAVSAIYSSLELLSLHCGECARSLTSNSL